MEECFAERNYLELVEKSLENMPVTAILGPRQCGKTTLVKHIAKNRDDFILLDMENEADIQAITQDTNAFFELYKDKIVCIDEIQRIPDLFPALRYNVDKYRKNGRFIVLGSASPDLIKQSSESLAGRIRYIEMTPFQLSEVKNMEDSFKKILVRGGFPLSFLPASDEISFEWRNDFIKTFLERDIPQLGFNIASSQMRRVWTMLAHINATTINRSKLGESLGVSYHTIDNYIGILTDTFMVRTLQPYAANIKKRLVKAPKFLFRDNGILHNLLRIKNYEELFSHPDFGSSFESFVIEQILSDFKIKSGFEAYFYRSHQGDEIDLLLDSQKELIAIEIKSSSAPKIPKGFFTAISDLKIKKAFVVAPVERSYPAGENIWVCGIEECIEKICDE